MKLMEKIKNICEDTVCINCVFHGDCPAVDINLPQDWDIEHYEAKIKEHESKELKKGD